MKKLLLLFFLTFALSASGQVTNAPSVIRELVIPVNPSTNFNCVSIRATIMDVTFDPTTFVPLFTMNIEAWGQDVTAGVTNTFIVGKRVLTTTTAQSKAWLAAADAKQFLTTALLNKAGLTQKP